MTVFKYYLKSFSKMKFTFILWIGFFVILLLFNGGVPTNKNSEFKRNNIEIAVSKTIINDKALALSKAFADNITINSIKNDEFSAKESVFLEGVSLAIIKDEQSGKIFCYKNPKSSYSYILTSKLKTYLDFLELSEKDGKTNPKLAGDIAKITITPTMINSTTENGYKEKWYNFTFRFLAYALMAVIMSIIGVSIISFKKDDINNRIKIASTSISNISLQTILAQLIGVFIITGLILTIIFAIGQSANINYSAYILNTSALSLSSLGLISLFASINTHKKFINSISSTLPLILAFISGVFVPIELLPKIATTISRFFPVFYYEKAVELATKGFSKEFLIYIAIQIMFGICFFLAGIVINRYKKAYYH